MENNLNNVMSFTPYGNFSGSVEELNTIMESEMVEVRKKVKELNNKNKQTIEEQTKAIEKKFKRVQNLYEGYDAGKFNTKTRIDLLFFEHLAQNLPEINHMEKLISNFYKVTKELYEIVNMQPENHKMLPTSVLVESYDDQQKRFSKIISEHINNHYYRINPNARKERFLNEAQEYSALLMNKGLDAEEAIKISVKSCLMETLIRNIAIPKFVQKRIKFLCEDGDYGKVFDQDHLKNLWGSFNKQSKDLSRVFAAAV